MAGVVASKVRKQRSALKADASRDTGPTQANYLNVGNIIYYMSRDTGPAQANYLNVGNV